MSSLICLNIHIINWKTLRNLDTVKIKSFRTIHLVLKLANLIQFYLDFTKISKEPQPTTNFLEGLTTGHHT